MSEQFDAEAAATRVRERLWAYLAGHSRAADIAAVAEGLFRLPTGDLRRLTAAHLALSSATAEMLAAVPPLLRELPSSVIRSEVETRAALRMPVNWPKTVRIRASTRDPSRYVCCPPERAYDTALARLLLLALRRCADLSHIAQVGSSGQAAEEVARVSSLAEHLMSHAKLREVSQVDAMPERTLASLRRHRSALPVIRFVRFITEALRDQSPAVVRDVVERRLLVPSRADRLFELIVGFALVDALAGAGYQQDALRLLPTKSVPFASMRRDGEHAIIYWQRSLWGALGAPAADSRYAQLLEGAGMRQATLRPDFVLLISSPQRVLLVEVKLTERAGETADRVGIREAMAYLHDAEKPLAQLPEPHGMVVAWGAEGRPVPGGRVLVSDENHVAVGLSHALERWDSAATPA